MIKLDALNRAVALSGLTQQELAENTGVTQAQISRFLSAKRNLSFFTYAKLCAAIGHKAKDFLTEEGADILKNELN